MDIHLLFAAFCLWSTIHKTNPIQFDQFVDRVQAKLGSKQILFREFELSDTGTGNYNTQFDLVRPSIDLKMGSEGCDDSAVKT